MDHHRFDALTRVIGRRGVLGAAFGTLIAVLLSRTDASAATACNLKGPDERCKRGSDCCSGRCKRKKKKNGKKGKGRCLCSQLLKPCFENFDCRGANPSEPGSIVCSDKNGFSEIVCCVSGTGPCRTDADCCGEFTCESGACGPT